VTVSTLREPAAYGLNLGRCESRISIKKQADFKLLLQKNHLLILDDGVSHQFG
jgi:hypothetical protein